MNTVIEELFFENHEYLSKAFDFEKLGDQLDFLGNCPDEFTIKPSVEVQRLSQQLHSHLISKGWIDGRMEGTLIYTQSKNVVEEYLRQCGRIKL